MNPKSKLPAKERGKHVNIERILYTAFLSVSLEQKKDTIRFSGYFCRYETFIQANWKLEDKLKDILYGAAHFETGSYNVYPLGFSDLLTRWQMDTDLIEFPSCEKLCHLKMFKNGRADLKFASAALAGEFVTKYLGCFHSLGR